MKKTHKNVACGLAQKCIDIPKICFGAPKIFPNFRFALVILFTLFGVYVVSVVSVVFDVWCRVLPVCYICLCTVCV